MTRQEVLSQVAGLSAALHAKAVSGSNHRNPRYNKGSTFGLIEPSVSFVHGTHGRFILPALPSWPWQVREIRTSPQAPCYWEEGHIALLLLKMDLSSLQGHPLVIGLMLSVLMCRPVFLCDLGG